SDNLTCLFFFSSRRRHTRFSRDWSSDVCSSDLGAAVAVQQARARQPVAARADAAQDRALARPLAQPVQTARIYAGRDRVGPADEIGRASCRERVENYESSASADKTDSKETKIID